MAYDYPQQYYTGWDPASAQADWQAKGKNLQSLQQVRGYTVGPIGQQAPYSSGITSGGGGTDWQSMLQETQRMAQEAAKPQIEAFQAQVPAAESRYQTLLKEITQGTQQAATAEFARRGIPLSSGIVESTVGQRLAPQIARAGDIRTTELGGINQAIAALQSGALSTGASSALDLYRMQESARQQAAQMAQQMEQQAWERPYQERLWEYQLAQPYYKPEAMALEPTPFPTFGGEQIQAPAVKQLAGWSTPTGITYQQPGVSTGWPPATPSWMKGY